MGHVHQNNILNINIDGHKCLFAQNSLPNQKSNNFFAQMTLSFFDAKVLYIIIIIVTSFVSLCIWLFCFDIYRFVYFCSDVP